MKLLVFYDNLIIIDVNGIWYIPDKVIKIEPTSSFLCFELIDKEGNYTSHNVELQWSKEFNIGFAYIPKTGLLGVM